MAIYNSFCFTGHGTSEVTGGYDPGATSQGVRENDLAKLFTEAAKKELSTNPLTKHLVIHYDEQNYVDNDLKGNSYKSNAGISVHINSGNGTGVEVFVPSKESYLAEDFDLVASISKTLGTPNRGVKSRDYDSEKTFIRTNGVKLNYKDYYKEIRQAWEQGISLAILEVGFIDTADLQKMQSKIKEVGFLIAKYIAKINNITLTSSTVSTTTSTSNTSNKKYYRICVGSYTDKQNATNALEEVKKKYPTAFIHEC